MSRVKNIMRLSIATRNFRCLSNHIIARRLAQTSICSAQISKEELVLARPEKLLKPAFKRPEAYQNLEKQIRRCTSLEEIFQFIKSCEDELKSSSVLQAFHSICHFVEPDKGNLSDIIKRDEFLILCDTLNKNLIHISLADCINMLNLLAYLNIPGTSIIVQNILQIISQSINNLSLRQLISVHHILRKYEETPLSEAIEIAIPLSYEKNVERQLDPRNVKDIKDGITYLSTKPKSQTPGILTALLQGLSNHYSDLDPTEAYQIILRLLKWKCHCDLLPEAVYNLLDILAKNLTDMSYFQIKNLLFKIVWNCDIRAGVGYHEGFFDAHLSAIIAKDDIEEGNYILWFLKVFQHANTPILDYFAGKCYEDPMYLKRTPVKQQISFIDCCSSFDYKPIFWDAIKDDMVKNIMKSEESYTTLFLATHLLVLDYYRPDLIAKAFEEFHSRKTDGIVYRKLILNLHQHVMAFHPEYTGPKLEDLSKFVFDFKLPSQIQCAFEHAFGGHQYVISNAMTKLHHRISFAVVMRKGGYPVAWNELSCESGDLIYVEDIKPPTDGQVILIRCLPPNAFTANTQRMNGRYALLERGIERITGCNVININSIMWLNLPEKEKIPYLMQAIRLKCNE